MLDTSSGGLGRVGQSQKMDHHLSSQHVSVFTIIEPIIISCSPANGTFPILLAGKSPSASLVDCRGKPKFHFCLRKIDLHFTPFMSSIREVLLFFMC